MADVILGKLEDAYRSLALPKLHEEAKAVQVVWARVKGYPAWPAQILSEAAAMRRPDLSQAAHSKEQKLPVMFFGTVEVAWVKDSDIVDFKEGLLQGYFDKKTKPFKLALEQVCEYLALDRKRKAPPKWWCKPPSNGMEDQSEASGSKPGAVPGVAKGPIQRQDAAKTSRQRTSPPESSDSASSSSEDDEPPAPRDAGKKGLLKPEGGRESGSAAAAKPKPPAAPAAKPRDSTAARTARESGSAAAFSSAATQSLSKRPASAPPSRPQPAAAAEAKAARPASNVAPSSTKPPAAAPPKLLPKLQPTGGALLGKGKEPGKDKDSGKDKDAGKEKDLGLPPRKRLKVEPSPTSAPGLSTAPAQPPAAPMEAPSTGAPGVAELVALGSGDIDVLKLPAEIRRLAGIRLPAVPKKPGAKVEESPREQLAASGKTDSKAATSTADAGAGGNAKPENAGAAVRARASAGGAKAAEHTSRVDAAAAARGKRSRRSRSPTASDEEEEDEASSGSSSESDDEDEGSQTSGDEADSEEQECSSESESEAEESADDDKAVAARQGSKGAPPRSQSARPQPQAQAHVPTQPKRDRRGEKQRRLARLAMPEPADRRTSSRLVPKPADKAPQGAAPRAASASLGSGKRGEDASRASSNCDSDDHDRKPKSGAACKGASDAEDGGRKLRSGRQSPEAPRAKSEPLPDAGLQVRKVATGLPPAGPSRPTSQPPEAARRSSACADSDGGDRSDHKKHPVRNGRVDSSGGGTSGAAAVKAIPLELRRLQNDASGGAPVVDTAEPRTLRDRPSPATRAAGPAAATPSHTGVTGSKRADKRSSDDGSGASMSVRDAEVEGAKVSTRTRSPEHRQESQKASPPDYAQGMEGHASMPGSAAGSASPPPAPMPAGVPVRSKPTTLGQAGGREPPALLPARAAACNLASKSNVPPPAAPSRSASAGAAAAGAPAPTCVAKKPSAGPPTRHVVERGVLGRVSSTELPDASPALGKAAEGDAEARPGLPVVAAGQADSLDSGGTAAPSAQRGPEGAPAKGTMVEAQAQLVRQPVPEPVELRPPPQRHDAPAQEAALVASTGEPMAEQGPAADITVRQASPQPPQPDALAASEQELKPEEQQQLPEPQPAVGRDEQQAQLEEAPQPREGAVAMDIDVQPAAEPVPQRPEVPLQQQPPSDATDASCSGEGPLQGLLPPTSDNQPQPASTSEPPAAPAQESCQPSRSPTHPLPLLEQHAAARPEEQEVQRRPCSRPPSPMREENLLAEEQLPPDLLDEQEAMQQCREGLGPGHTVGTSTVTAAVEPTTCTRLTSDESLSEDMDQQPAGTLPLAACAQARRLRAGDDSSAGGSEGARGGTADASCTGTLPAGAVMDDKDAAHARELEELGEVAAALAGLHQAEPPRLPPIRAPQPEALSATAAVHAEALLDRLRSRGFRGSSGRGGSSREDTAAPSQQAPASGAFRWPQPEPLLPSQDQPFSLPRDWLLTRPPRYEPIRRNVYHSRVKPKRLPKDEISICACRPPPPGDPRPGCGPNCLNRLSSVLCDSKLCPCGELCSNRSLHLLRPPKTEVFLTENRGWGVRALEPVQKGGFIIEYAGEVIDERELGRRMDHARMNGEPHFYIMELSAGLYIDARRKGNTARLINSSCDPNCETQKWHDASTGEVRVGIFATREIPPGEELVYDYFFSTYGAMKQCASSFVCMCGAKNCRGTMDLHPEKRRDLGRRVEVFWDADGQYYRAVVVAYHPTSRKHTVMYEDGGTEKLCLDDVPHRWMDESPAKRDSPRGDATFRPAQQPSQPGAPPGKPQVARGDADAQVSDSSRNAAAMPIPAVVAQPPPRVAEQPCGLPPLGSAAAVSAQAHETLGKHGLQENELHLPLKKRQKMMQQPLATQNGARDAHAGSSLPQASANGGDAVAGGAPGGPADSVGRDGGRELSGDASAAAAADDETAEDLSSLLEAAEAVAALRTAPVGHPPSSMLQQDSVLPLQPRHIRGGDTMASAAGASGAVAMVQTAKVASPRHLAVAQRSGPPNGLPPHGGSSGFGRPSAHPSSSSGSLAGHRQQRPGQQSHDTSPVGHHDLHQAHYGKNGRSGALQINGVNGYGANGSKAVTNGINREDLLWRLVGIEKPNDLLPLFACEKKDSWSSHPYGKLLRALEASELLPHAEQLRQQYQQVQQAPQQQALQPQPLPTAVQHSQPHTGMAAGAAAAATATALAAWHAQHAAAQQHAAAHAQATAAQYSVAHAGAAYTAPTSMASLLQVQQQHAAAAAAAAASSTHHVTATASACQPPAHASAAAPDVAGSSMAAAHLAVQQPHQLAAVAAQWQQMAHVAHQGQIWQDLLGMYVAQQHAQQAAPHPMLAMAGAAAAASVPAAPVR